MQLLNRFATTRKSQHTSTHQKSPQHESSGSQAAKELSKIVMNDPLQYQRLYWVVDYYEYTNGTVMLVIPQRVPRKIENQGKGEREVI